jgi:hypothetical protein
MRDSRVRLKIGNGLYDQTVKTIDDEAARNPVIQSFMDKYPDWNNPGNADVHIFLVG